MKAYVPFEITDDMVISSSIAEPDASEPEWSSAVTYVEGNSVSVIDTNSHLVYEALANVTANLNKPPATSPTFWIEKSKTNKFRMFDYNQGNPSVAQSPLTVVLRPGKRIDAITLDLKAAEVDIAVKDGIDGDDVFTLNGYLLERNVTSFYEFFFAPFVYRKLVTTFQVPPVADPVIYLTLTDPSGVVEVDGFAVGLSTYLGAVQDTGPIADTDNYSEITTDDFGKTTFNPVPSVPKAELTLFAKANKTELIRQFKRESEAKIAVWSGLDDIENPYTQSLVLFGFHRSFPIDLSDRNIVVVRLSLKGV